MEIFDHTPFDDIYVPYIVYPKKRQHPLPNPTHEAIAPRKTKSNLPRWIIYKVLCH